MPLFIRYRRFRLLQSRLIHFNHLLHIFLAFHQKKPEHTLITAGVKNSLEDDSSIAVPPKGYPAGFSSLTIECV